MPTNSKKPDKKRSFSGKEKASSSSRGKAPVKRSKASSEKEPGRRAKPSRGRGSGRNKKEDFSRGSKRRTSSWDNERQYREKNPTGDDRPKSRYNEATYRKKPGEYPEEIYKTKRVNDGTVRLNKYIANTGVCSRREADELIASGAVTVNGKVITEMGFKVAPGDVVVYGGERLKREKPVYLLLNKPKDYITTMYDPKSRKSVMELIRGACKERVYPVGRLDRATTGLLLFTNDGELTKRLTHPRYGVKKIYHVSLDKNLTKAHLVSIANGIELEDGPIHADEISYVGTSKKEVGLVIHSGRNRIIRRIFEHLGYKVTKLDRVYFAGLTKKDLPKGRWRFLTEQEVNILKMTAK